MPELDPLDSGRDDASLAQGGDGAPDQPGRPKKKDKFRSVWISFIGRIVAQIIGAIASVALGIFILQRYQDPPGAPPADAPAPAPRPHGERALAVLPLDNFSRDPADSYVAQGMTEVLISDLAQIKGWPPDARWRSRVTWLKRTRRWGACCSSGIVMRSPRSGRSSARSN